MNLAHNTAILWHGPGSVQVGGDRSRHVLLDNLHAGDQIWLSNQAHPAHEREETQASPELLAALTQARLTDCSEALPHLALGIVGAVPATLLALHSLVDTFSLSLSIETHTLVDEDWDRVFGGHYTGTPRHRAVRRTLRDLIPLSQLYAQGTPELSIVSADRVVDPGIPFELTAHDAAHLIVTRGEHSYEVGPFVIPGVTPCYQCSQHARAAADPFHLAHLRELESWPLAPLALLAHFAAAQRIGQLVMDFASGTLTESQCAQVATIGEDGLVRVEEVEPATDCVCGIDGLASSLTPLRRR